MSKTLTIPTAHAVTRNIASRVRSRIAAVMIALTVLVVGTAGTASAQEPPTDLTDGAGDTFFTTITNYFTADVLPKVLVLMALTVGVSVLIKWAKRAAKSS